MSNLSRLRSKEPPRSLSLECPSIISDKKREPLYSFSSLSFDPLFHVDSAISYVLPPRLGTGENRARNEDFLIHFVFRFEKNGMRVMGAERERAKSERVFSTFLFSSSSPGRGKKRKGRGGQGGPFLPPLTRALFCNARAQRGIKCRDELPKWSNGDWRRPRESEIVIAATTTPVAIAPLSLLGRGRGVLLRRDKGHPP